jgi:hypothetical protein
MRLLVKFLQKQKPRVYLNVKNHDEKQFFSSKFSALSFPRKSQKVKKNQILRHNLMVPNKEKLETVRTICIQHRH